jgi:iron complex outermembrane receptor protein
MKKQYKFRNSSVVFNQWNNTSYAVFNSLKRIVKIGALSVAYLVFANPDSLSAQSNDSLQVANSFDLDQIDVTAEQLPELYSALSRVVVTITRDEIERAAVSSVNELLEYASNIDIRQRGSNGMQADISIRGGSFDQVLILLNGINITDPQTGHHNLNLPVNLSSIERIEILKGPGAWKFGPGAFSGAINFVTNSSDKQFVNAAVEGGQFGFNGQSASTMFKAGNTHQSFSVNRSSSNGYVENTDFSGFDLYYHGKYYIKQSELQLQGGISDKAFGANSFYTAMFPNQYEEIKTRFASVGLKTSLNNIVFEPSVYYRRNNDLFILFRDNPPLYSNYHTTDVYGLNLLNAVFHAYGGITTIGAGSRTENIYSNNLGKEAVDVRYSTVNDTILLDKTHARTNFSLFAGHKTYIDNLMVNVGLNLTYNTDLPGKWFLYPGFDLNYDFGLYSSVFASANKTMRMPSFTDLYYTSPNNRGNPDLLPEEALGFDLGYRFNRKGLNFSLTTFTLRGDNMIDWVRETVNDQWRTINYTSLNTLGAELQFNLNLQEIIPENNFLNTLKLAYTFIDIEKEESNLISNYSLNYLKHRFDASLNHKMFNRFNISWHVAYQHRNGGFEKIVNRVSEGMVDFDPFITADLKIAWDYNGWKLYGSINNLFDTEYYDIGNVPQPGRWIKAGIVKKINFE